MMRELFTALVALTMGTLMNAAFLGSVQAQTVPVEGAEFVVFLSDGKGNEFIYKSRIVPLIPDLSCYGWRLRLVGGKGLIKFKEILSLPTEPEYWSGEKDEFSTHEITDARRTSITEEFVTMKDGWIKNSWCVAPGDPEGEYSMEVYINGQFVKRFDFEVRNIQPHGISPLQGSGR